MSHDYCCDCTDELKDQIEELRAQLATAREEALVLSDYNLSIRDVEPPMTQELSDRAYGIAKRIRAAKSKKGGI